MLHDTKQDDSEFCENWTLNIPQHLFSLEKISLSEIDESELLDHEKCETLIRILSSAPWRDHQSPDAELGQGKDLCFGQCVLQP